MSFHHITVLLKEAVDGLRIRPDGIYVDCTLGGGGHSAAIAAKLGPQGRLIALDQDDAALAYAQARLAEFMANVTLVKSNFRYLAQALREAGVPEKDGAPRVDGVLFDLGVSSPQLDEAERGFSYNLDAELDMRMDRSQSLTAAEIVNEWAEHDIARILREYGEERFARQIARRIAAVRKQTPITSTGQLVDLIKSAIPAPARRTGPHPAKRSFQALRIAVNDELGAFRDALSDTIDLLKPGGRVAVITFHSLEDRICKTMFAAEVTSCTCPPDFPQCVCGGGAGRLRLTPRKPIVPSAREVQMNPRARSAKLRIAEKL